MNDFEYHDWVKVLLKENWDYLLYDIHEELYLSTVVFSYPLDFMIHMKLNDEERKEYGANGKKYIEELVHLVREHADEYQRRYVNLDIEKVKF